MVGDIYRHYKGNFYRVLRQNARLEADGPDGPLYVIYEALDDRRLWLRPYNEFHGTVVVDGREVPRFAPIEQ